MSYEIMHNVMVEGILQNKAAGMSRVVVGGNDVMVSDKYVHLMPTKTYEDGLNEAWETARRIVLQLTYGELQKIFAIEDIEDTFKNFTAAEAAAKIAAWEDGKQLRVGDVVERNEGELGVVTEVLKEECCVMWSRRDISFECQSVLTKTGRTVDIKSVLEAIGGEGE